MKIFFTFTGLLLSFVFFAEITNAQFLNKDTIKTAPVEVTVIDGKKAPRVGEKVIFTGKKTGNIFQGRTNKAGKLSIALPAGDEYTVILNALTDSTKFGTLPIPALSGTQFYKNPFVIEMKYEPAKVFTLNDVHFDFGKATLREESFKQLDELYEYLKWKETCKIEVAGHTDNAGPDNENLLLSQKRAESVKAWLIKKGIQPARIIAKGYGANQPVADNTTEEGRHKTGEQKLGSCRYSSVIATLFTESTRHTVAYFALLHIAMAVEECDARKAKCLFNSLAQKKFIKSITWQYQSSLFYS